MKDYFLKVWVAGIFVCFLLMRDRMCRMTVLVRTLCATFLIRSCYSFPHYIACLLALRTTLQSCSVNSRAGRNNPLTRSFSVWSLIACKAMD